MINVLGLQYVRARQIVMLGGEWNRRCNGEVAALDPRPRSANPTEYVNS